jgi:hypothetical protein
MANVIDQVGAAKEAFRMAGLQASQTTRDLFNRFGYTMQGADGSYSPGNAAAAWDPERLRMGTGGGAYVEGDTGEFANIRRAGSEQEAMAAQESLDRGLVGGGLAAQRRNLAEYQTGNAITDAKKEFENLLGGISTNYASDYINMETRVKDATDAAAQEAAAAYAANPTSQERVFGYGKPGGKDVPKYGKKDKGKMYQGPGGVNWKWDGKGWKKQIGGGS